MSEAEPKITVIVINFNSGRFLSDCLLALKQQNYKKFRVVVGDNNSDDDSLATAVAALADGDGEIDPRFKFLEFEENLGFAKANNHLAGKVRTPLIALLNPDAIPEPDWLETLVETADNHRDVAMFGSTQLMLHDASRYDGVGDNYFAVGVPWRGGYGHSLSNIEGVYEVFSPCAAAALYRTESFMAIGGFDETYFCYVEDVDLGFRLRLSGHRCLQVADATVRHAGGASSKGKSFAIFHGTRNMIWTFVKNMPGPFFYPILPLHICLIVILTIRALTRGDAGPTVRGIAASFAELPRCWSLRRRIQSGRSVSLRVIARAMCWIPWYYLRRAPFSLGRVSTAPN